MSKEVTTPKRLTAVSASSIRELVSFINTHTIMKENVLEIIKDDDIYFLMYYTE